MTPAWRARASTSGRSSRTAECVRFAPISMSCIARGVYSRAMPSTDAALEVETRAQEPVPVRVRASGAWTFAGLKEHHDTLLARFAELEKQPPGKVAWDLTGISALDDAGAVWL